MHRGWERQEVKLRSALLSCHWLRLPESDTRWFILVVFRHNTTWGKSFLMTVNSFLWIQ